jgi:uncharacterized protein with ParB-like and HNH nuclease domain
MAQIEVDKLFINKVFQKWYRIPEYQRPYVWGTDQVIELLNDVYQAYQANSQSEYFLGCMVLQKSHKQNGSTQYEEFDVLDGQQRLTTLLLLTSVVRDLAPDSNEKLLKVCGQAIFQEEDPFNSIPERNRVIFDIRAEVQKFADTYIRPESRTQIARANKDNEIKQISQRNNEDISIRNMANAILVIQGFFQDGDFLINDGELLNKFYIFLQTKVLMIYVATEEREDAFNLFTVMNSRGMKLRNSDILKAENLAKITNDKEREVYAKKWEEIEGYFAEDFDIFLSHLRTILVKQKAAYNLLKEYEENIYNPKEFDRNSKKYSLKPPLLMKGKDTFDFIERYYNSYRFLFENEHFNLTNSFEIYNQLILMQTGFEADYWIAPFLRYYDKYKTNDLLKFLYLLDIKFSADWVIGLSPTKRIENTNAIIKEIEIAADQASLFGSDVFKFETQDFIRVLSGGIYRRGYDRYILLKIDLAYHGHTTKFSPPPTISIEHILPRNPSINSQWSQDFDQNDRDKWTNKIGNLILLSRRKNSSQSNLDFDLKKQKYFQKNIELFSNSVRIFNNFSTWSLADLKKNHKEMLKKLLLAYNISIKEFDLEKIMD